MSEDSSESECEWEEVTEGGDDNAEEVQDYEFPKEGIQITIEGSEPLNRRRGKKDFDPGAIIRRELNQQKRELQVDLHKVSVLCFLARGLEYNKILRNQDLFDLASAALKAKTNSTLPKHVDLGYMEKIVRWFKATFLIDRTVLNLKTDENILNIETFSENLSVQLKEYKVANYDYLVFIFIILLRSLGIQARLVWSFNPLPLKPDSSDLLKAPTKAKKETPASSQLEVKPGPSGSKIKSNLKGEEKGSSKNAKARSSNSKRSVKPKEEESSGESESEPRTAKKLKFDTESAPKGSKGSMKTFTRNSSTTKNVVEKSEKNASKKQNKSSISQTSSSKPDASTGSPIENRVLRKRPDTKSTQNNVKYSQSVKSEDFDFQPEEDDSDSNSDSDFEKVPAKKAKRPAVKPVSEKRPNTKPTNSTKKNESLEGWHVSPRTKTSKNSVSVKKQNSVTVSPKQSTPTNKGRKVVAPLTMEKVVYNFWLEVYLEEEELWISVDVMESKFLCDETFERKVYQPLCYAVAFGNLGQVKDVTRRYASQWLTITQKYRADSRWWNKSIRPFRGIITAQDREEDDFLDQQILSQPFPKSIQEFKNHPLFVLRRHLLKFEAIYPMEPMPIGFVRNEPFFSRECVKILHSRELWLRKAKVVRIGEIAYKIVKSRPKYIRLTGQVIKDQPLELFGEWQVEDYIPPEAENGKVPRNEYGNVNLFLEKMLPKGTIHLELPGLQRVARKLDIDCAPAVVGFDFNSGGCFPSFQGFVVCEEFKDILLDAWNQEQDQIAKKEDEKRQSRIYGNWRRLIRGVLLREKLENKYSFNLGGKRKPGTADNAENPSTEARDAPSGKRRCR